MQNKTPLTVAQTPCIYDTQKSPDLWKNVLIKGFQQFSFLLSLTLGYEVGCSVKYINFDNCQDRVGDIEPGQWYW